MKAKIIISVLTALVMGACSSSYMAKSGNDDLYYTPRSGGSAQQSQTETAKVSETKNSPSSEKRSSAQMTDYEKYRASMDNKELADTTGGGQNYADNTEVQNAADSKEPVVKSDEYYGEGGDSYIYNNYYYTSRLNRFHGGFYDPYFYDSYYFDTWCSPWYSTGWNFSIGWGWGYGYPYYSDYYYPYYGGYWGYYGYNPYYYGHHHYGYYDGYGYGSWGGNYYSNRSYGRIPNRSNMTNTAYGRNRSNTTGYYSGSREKSTRINANAGSSRGGYISSGRRYTNDNYSTRGTNDRSVYTRRAPAESNGTVNGRRFDNSGNSSSRGRTDYNSGNSRNSGNERTYTPYYSQPRNSSRAPYNGSSNSYSGSRGSSPSSSSGYSRSSSSGSYSGYSSPRRETSNESSSSRSYTPSSSGSSSYSSGSSSTSSRSSSGGGGSSSSSSSSSGGGGRRR